MLFEKEKTVNDIYEEIVETLNLRRIVKKHKDVLIRESRYTLRDIETMKKPELVELLIDYQKEYITDHEMIFSLKELKSWRVHIIKAHFLQLINRETYLYYLDISIARSLIPSEYVDIIKPKIDLLQKSVRNQPYV